jgi:rubrerythrin
MSHKNPLDPLLNIALAMSTRHYEYYTVTAEQVQMPKVKALLNVLADTERDLIAHIRHMMVTGILDEIEVLERVTTDGTPPDDSPIAAERIDTDPRIYVCNKALEQEIKGYTFYLSLAARAKTDLVSRLFEYLAFVKSQQIEHIRKVCTTF